MDERPALYVAVGLPRASRIDRAGLDGHHLPHWEPPDADGRAGDDADPDVSPDGSRGRTVG